MTAQGAEAERGVAFGKYSLIAKLATGGMGEIFLARLSGMAGFEKLVVIKRLLPHLAEDSHFVTMLLDEARIAARLSHPNVCQVYDLGEVDGQYYIAMEYLEGVPISQMLERARGQDDLLDLRMASALLAQSCEGLHHAHELKDKQGVDIGLVHRDVSPSNLFLTTTGVVKVLDFGVAKSQDALARTHTGALKGKYAYMSPEQVLTHPVDRRSDIFSLGIVLFELLTARRLFWRDSEYKMFQAIAEDDIPSVNMFRPEVPEAITRVVECALSRDPGARYPHAKALAEDLARAVAPLGGFLSSASIADFVSANFDPQIRERRELVLTASSSDAGLARTQAAKPRPHRPTGRPQEQDDNDTTGGVSPAPAMRPLGIDATSELQALSTGGGWKVIAGALLGVLVAGGAAFAYVQMRESRPAPSTPVTVVQGNVTPEPGPTKSPGAVSENVVPADAGTAEVDDSLPGDNGAATSGSRTVRVSPPESKPAELSKVIQRARGAWKQCITRNPLKTDSAIEINLTIKINTRGKVASATLSNPAVRNTPVGRCLIRVTKGLRFRAEDGGASVTQGLTIKPRSAN